jgi:multidrug efflux pump subunit AcrA (membrane-fusion protein)
MLADDLAPVARVPVGALFETASGPSVWTVDAAAGAVTATPVVVDGYDAQSAYIASGVAEGAEIVALGAHKLDSKQKVRVVENLAGL